MMRLAKGMSADQYRLLGDVLYATHDFQRSIRVYVAGGRARPRRFARGGNRNMSRFNTIGLCWQKLGRLDSASYHRPRAGDGRFAQQPDLAYHFGKPGPDLFRNGRL